jgi:nicotinate-nucleotide adenylyltransferase
MTAAPESIVGVLGGTFDPVHVGHLAVAEGVRDAFALPRVLLVPCNLPPHKIDRRISSAADRIAMLRLAVAGRRALEVATIEVERGGVSFTIDTLRELRGLGLAPLFLVGVDALAELPTWREFEAILDEFDLVAVDRPGGSVDSAKAALGPALARRVIAAQAGTGGAEAPGGGGRIFHLALPPTDVASRDIRKRAAAGLPLDGLVPPAVGRYIQERRLYREEALR